MSLVEFAPVSVVLPKVAVALKEPVTKTSLVEFTQMPNPISLAIPPAFLAHCTVPELLYLAINASCTPLEVRLTVPKVAVPLKYPVIYTFPDASTAMALARSEPVPPALTAH